MKPILHSEGCPFDFTDWMPYRITQLYAGNGCVMALTEDGEVLQKVEKQEVAARLDYWKNIRGIAISQFIPGLAVGLVKDGTCMVSKRALRRCCEITGCDFDRINGQIKALQDIVEVQVSDAVFALDRSGKVHKIPLCRQDSYSQVEQWENIAHLAVGSQDFVIGITREGKALCDGANALRGRDVRERLAACTNVADVCVMGSEGEQLLLALGDGSLTELKGNVLPFRHKGSGTVFRANFRLCAIACENGQLGFVPYCSGPEAWESLTKHPTAAFAVGVTETYAPFAVLLPQ